MAITPYLYYADVAAARRFLAKAFGFKPFGATFKDATGKLTHAAARLGKKDVVMMGCPGPAYKNPRQLKQGTQALYVNAPNVDKLFLRPRKAGAKILEEPKDTPYGDRRFGAEDPEGHQWYFAHALRRRRGARKRA